MFEVICNALFPRGEKAKEVCVEILNRIREKGYTRIPPRGMEWYVSKRLVELGLLNEKRLPCAHQNTVRKVLVVNHKLLLKMYEELQSLKSPPMMLEEC